MKQIQIYELLPLLRPGFVAMDEDKSWYWYIRKPTSSLTLKVWGGRRPIKLSFLFNIAPYDGNWQDSLMECGDHIADASKMVADIKK